jgi:RNA polymerase primary sigma factor
MVAKEGEGLGRSQMWSQNHDHDDAIPSYLNRLTQAPLLNAEEEVILTRAAQAGDAEARQRLVESNMRLVINIARSYRSRAVPLEDLIQEGAIGLMYAIARFDPDKGFRFSTYATHWVRQSIGRAIDNKSKAIRLPAHISQSLRRIERERARLTRELGCEPSIEQIAATMGISPKKLVALMHFSQDLLSLDMKVGENENTTLGNLIRGADVADPETEAMGSEMAHELQQIMQELSDRERRVMSYRLKMDEMNVDLRDDLAKELQLSRERIRQIETQAIKKLRALAQRRKLKEILNS